MRLTVVGGCGAWPGKDAARAGVGRLLLTHLLPGTAPGLAEAAARATFTGEVGVAHGGIVADLGP